MLEPWSLSSLPKQWPQHKVNFTFIGPCRKRQCFVTFLVSYKHWFSCSIFKEIKPTFSKNGRLCNCFRMYSIYANFPLQTISFVLNELTDTFQISLQNSKFFKYFSASLFHISIPRNICIKAGSLSFWWYYLLLLSHVKSPSLIWLWDNFHSTHQCYHE